MSKTLAKFLAGLVEVSTKWQSRWRRAGTKLRVSQSLIQEHAVQTPKGLLTFRSSYPQALDYPSALMSREADTISWIDSFDTPCVFWDVGANIGAYSIYTALNPETRVLAFEPASASYAALCENIRVNGMDDRVLGFCIALAEKTGTGHLNMENVNAASVSHAFESQMTSSGKTINTVFRQSVIGFSADDFQSWFEIPLPNYIKIDVDSIEFEILTGAKRILRHPDLRGILVEAAGSEKRLESIRSLVSDEGFEEISLAGAENMIFSHPHRLA